LMMGHKRGAGQCRWPRGCGARLGAADMGYSAGPGYELPMQHGQAQAHGHAGSWQRELLHGAKSQTTRVAQLMQAALQVVEGAGASEYSSDSCTNSCDSWCILVILDVLGVRSVIVNICLWIYVIESMCDCWLWIYLNGIEKLWGERGNEKNKKRNRGMEGRWMDM
jgi:hypothetical protein